MFLRCLILLIATWKINIVFSFCNLCGRDTQIACINQTAFRRCSGSAIIPGPIFVCPSGTFCNSDDVIRCVDSEPSCGGRCGVCNLNTYVACLSRTKYAFCFDTGISNQTGYCSEEEYCNSEYPGICINSAGPIVAEPTCQLTPDPPTTTIEPSTSTIETSTSSSTTSTTPISTTSTATTPTTSTTTTPTTSTTTTSTTRSPITGAQQFCLAIGKAGKFPKLNDATCKRYYYCYNFGSNIMGQEYTCVGLSYYNCKAQSCSATCDRSCSILKIAENYKNSKVTEVA